MSLEENQDGLSDSETETLLGEAEAFNRESRKSLEAICARMADVEARGKSEQVRLNTAIESELDAFDAAESSRLVE